jgi:DNA-directed RNA polymerase specialized sigma24 family protein
MTEPLPSIRQGVARSLPRGIAELRAEVMDFIYDQFGKDHVVSHYFAELEEPEWQSLFADFASTHVVDRTLFMFFAYMKDETCPISDKLISYFWQFFYDLGNEKEGFTRGYSPLGRTDRTSELLSDVLLKLVHGRTSIEFRSVPEFNAIVSLRMHWRILDQINLVKKRSEVDIGIDTLAQAGELLEEIVDEEQRMRFEKALLLLPLSEQSFLADYMKMGDSNLMADKYGISSDAVRQRKLRLRKKIEEIVSDQQKILVKPSAATPLIILLYASGNEQVKVHRAWAKKHFERSRIVVRRVDSLTDLHSLLPLVAEKEKIVKGSQDPEKNTKLLYKVKASHVFIVHE